MAAGPDLPFMCLHIYLFLRLWYCLYIRHAMMMRSNSVMADAKGEYDADRDKSVIRCEKGDMFGWTVTLDYLSVFYGYGCRRYRGSEFIVTHIYLARCIQTYPIDYYSFKTTSKHFLSASLNPNIRENTHYQLIILPERGNNFRHRFPRVRARRKSPLSGCCHEVI